MPSQMITIDKFTGKNDFSLWRIKMRALLKQHGIWTPLSGERPDEMTESEFAKQDEKAHSTILLSLADEVIYEVADEESAASLWLKIESLYMTKSLTNKLLLKQRLFSLRMKEGMLLKEHVDELNSILMDLKNVKEVRSSLHSRELQHKASGSGSESQSVGLSVISGDRDRGRDKTREKEKGKWKSRGRSRSKSRGPGGRQREGCHYWKEPGHWKNECPKLRAKGSASVVNDDSGSETDLVLTVLANENSVSEDDLVLGGLQPEASQWQMPCHVVGIGSMSIKMHDGMVRTLTDVRHVPDMKKNLISLGALDKKGFKYSGGGGVIRVTKGALVVMKGVMKDTLYFLEGNTIVGSAAPAHSLVENESDLTCLWHMRLGYVSEKGMVILSKKGLLGAGKKIKRLRTDNGLEFCSGEFDRFCKDEGIARHRTVRHTPQQNGVAERMNRTLLERVRCVLSNAGLPRSFWAEALNTVCYLVKRSPATAIDCKTPFEVWSGKPEDYTGLRVFGCPSYYHVSEGKLEPRSKKGLFMGYGDDVKGYRIWCLDKRKVILSRDVKFDEESMLRSIKGSSTPSVQEEKGSEQVEFELNGPNKGENPPRRQVSRPVRYGFDDVVDYALQVVEDVEFFKPFTYKEAITSKEANMLVAVRNMDESKKLRRFLSFEFG
ncbi:hypothetical protein OSB04_019790 [Centaurea solstitialis]|uniref:Integrase catalytic domain-containing protein n=1 Tax=Centaurea solstitialis TaxID=347529 RepID=A0AA38W5C0_9ASTR|nr:hypothetical protein OSB04_019790 [Centaurea solstitialis]